MHKSSKVSPQTRPRVRRILTITVRPTAYLALLYGLTRFPLAILYLIVLVGGLSTGFALLAVGVGVVVLLLVLIAGWGGAIFEREVLAWWFGYSFPPMSANLDLPVWATSGGALWRRLLAFVRNPVTWTALLHAFIQIVFGLVVSTLLLIAATATVALIASPLVFLAGAVTWRGGDPSQPLAFGGSQPPLSLLLVAVAPIAGFILLAVLLHGAGGVVRVNAFFARALLSVSPAQLQLGEARAAAAAERSRADRSEQSRRRLIVDAGHELRTPIASVQGHVEALLAGHGQGSEEEQRRYLEVIRRETERLGSLVDDLLAVARAEAGELRLEVRPVQVAEVVDEIAGTLAPIAERDRQIKLIRPASGELPPAWADRDRLAQVLMNLARNAILYTPEGGIVSLETAQADGYVEIAVADTGVGIAPEDLEKIFDRFYRADASRTRTTGGFGLGLGISRDLVQAMGGTIAVASEPGSGSRFTVRLRRVD